MRLYLNCFFFSFSCLDVHTLTFSLLFSVSVQVCGKEVLPSVDSSGVFPGFKQLDFYLFQCLLLCQGVMYLKDFPTRSTRPLTKKRKYHTHTFENLEPGSSFPPVGQSRPVVVLLWSYPHQCHKFVYFQSSIDPTDCKKTFLTIIFE